MWKQKNRKNLHRVDKPRQYVIITKNEKRGKDKEKEIIKGKKMHKTMTGKPMSDVDTKEQTKIGKKSAQG